MSYRFYDYQCTNNQCTEYEKTEELMVKADAVDEQLCCACGQKLRKLVNGINSKHSSWSSWQPIR